jgi:hypothetical protein
MKSSNLFAALVTALATICQSAIATPTHRITQYSLAFVEPLPNLTVDYHQQQKPLLERIDSYRPSVKHSQPDFLTAQQSDLCRQKGTFPVTINIPDNNAPIYSGQLKDGINVRTRCISLVEVSSNVSVKSKPKTWLIIHGWLNDANSDNIKALAAAVAKQNPGDRVLILDWGDAAMNFGNSKVFGDEQTILGVSYAATWIRPIAEVVVDKLKSDYKLTEQEANQSLNIIGHSLGTLMSSEIGAVYYGINSHGKKVRNGLPINSIIALDPPAELSPALNLGGYDLDGRTPAYTYKNKSLVGTSQRDIHPEAIDKPKYFNRVSRFSRAFVGAKSLAGNQEFASWAHESFQMAFVGDEIRESPPGSEHGRVVKAFINLISQHPFNQPNSNNSFLDLNDITAHNNCTAKGASYFMKCNTVDGKHEGIVSVNSSNLPTSVKFTTSSGKIQQIVTTRSQDLNSIR